MTWDDRLFYLILGILIGLAMAKIDDISKKVDVMKKELDEVDEIVKNQRGSISGLTVRNVIIGVLLIATSYSAIESGIAKSHSDNAAAKALTAANRVEIISTCDRSILKDLLISVNQRSANTRGLGETNVEFQQSFRNLFGLLIHVPPFSQADQTAAAKAFFNDQNKYIHISKKQVRDVVVNPLPTIKDYSVCVQMKENTQ